MSIQYRCEIYIHTNQPRGGVRAIHVGRAVFGEYGQAQEFASLTATNPIFAVRMVARVFIAGNHIDISDVRSEKHVKSEIEQIISSLSYAGNTMDT